ncbi:MAG: hypothetical protein ACI3VK_07100 [Oscillospiraceae bacterium]
MKKLLLIIVFAFILTGSCHAELYDENELRGALPEYADELMGDDTADTDKSLGALAAELKDGISENMGSALRRAIAIVAVAMICSMLNVFSEDVPDYVSLGGCAAIALISIADVNSFINSSADALNSISVFSKTLLPALCAAGAACGTLGSAMAKYAASVLFMDAFVTMAQYVIMPLIYAYLAVHIAAVSLSNKNLASVSKLIKWLCTCLMTFTALAFTVYISLSSVIASGGDAVASKFTKTAISTALPVVGSIISDAASTVVAGAEMLRNSVGVFGMLAVLAICVAPFAVMGINYLAYKAAAAMIQVFRADKLSALADGIGSAIGMLLGLIGCCAVILFISIGISIKAVGG